MEGMKCTQIKLFIMKAWENMISVQFYRKSGENSNLSCRFPHSRIHGCEQFTLIELLMKYTCQPCNYVLYYKRE